MLFAFFRVFVPFLWLFLIALGVMSVSYVLTSRQVRVLEIISTIGLAMRQNLPLATALESAAGKSSNRHARIYRNIALWLSRGFTLSEAIRQGYLHCPGQVIAMISMAEKVDQVPLAIKCIEEDLLEKSQDRNRIKPNHPLYPFLLIAMIFFIVTGFLVFILPKFKEIYMDFDVELPHSTLVLLDIGDFTYHHGWIPAGMTIFIFFILPFSVYLKFRTRTPANPRSLSVVGDWIKWHLPVLRGFEWRYSLVQVTAYLRLALRAGATVDRAVANSSQLDVNQCFRQKLRRWSNDIKQGENVAKAARRYGLGRGIAWVFDKNVNPQNVPEILGMLEMLYRRSYRHRLLLVRYICWPCLIAGIGVLVGFVVYAIFTPIVAMIDAVALDVIP
jgi:type II secretory pathway component PulF